jgi:DedD protein
MRAYRKIDDHFEVKIEKGRLVVLGVGAGLTLLLVFLVGVLVGKGLWGARPELMGTPSAQSTSQPPVQEPEKPQYTFYDDLKRPDSTAPKVMPRAPGAQELVGETTVPAPRSAETASQVQETSGTLPASSPPVAREKPTELPREHEPPAVPAKAAKTALPVKPVADSSRVAEAPRRVSEPPADAIGKPSVEAKIAAPSYTVQVGSFRDRASADEQAKKIASQSISAQVVLAPMEGRTWFRVQVGRFDARADAESYYQKKLRPKGIQGFVTQR